MKMSGVLFGVALLLGLALTGCETGGGGDSEPDYGTNNKDLYVAIGDSITHGSGLDNPDESYPDVLSGLLGKRVINEGLPGEEAWHGLDRFDEVLQTYKPGHILILYGVNDLIAGTGPEYIKSDLRQMIQLARANKTVPVLGTLTPVQGRYSDLYDRALLTSAAIRQLGAEEGVAVADLEAAFNNRSDLLIYDGLHPNAAGHRLMAETFAGVLK